jgi:hypothetical protein
MCNVTWGQIHVGLTIVAMEEPISVKYYERVSVFLPVLPGMQITCFVCCIIVVGSTIFFRIIS